MNSCPVCAGSSRMLDVMDFNRSCLHPERPLSGIPIYYFQCDSCGFLYAPEFLSWPDERFRDEIYNEGYRTIDPDHEYTRPKSNADFLIRLFGTQPEKLTHLDFGGGNGRLTELLQKEGWASNSYDPYSGHGGSSPEPGFYNLITAFEVFEHVPHPRKLVEDLRALLKAPGLIIFSTGLLDGIVKPGERLTWWYASPRNGHISLYSRESLIRLGKLADLRFGSFYPNMHAYFSDLPDWAKHLIV